MAGMMTDERRVVERYPEHLRKSPPSIGPERAARQGIAPEGERRVDQIGRERSRGRFEWLTNESSTLTFNFPQTLLRAVPSLLSNVVSLFKESAIVSAVGMVDLLFVGQNISNMTARPIEILTTVALIYFVVAFPLTRLVTWLETRTLRKFAI